MISISPRYKGARGLVAGLVALLLAVPACGGDGRGEDREPGDGETTDAEGAPTASTAAIEWSPSAISFDSEAETATRIALVWSAESTPLRIDRIELEYDSPDTSESAPPFHIQAVRARRAGETRATFRPEDTDLSALSALHLGNTQSDAEFSSLQIEIVYTRPSAVADLHGRLVIASNAPDNPEVGIPISASPTVPRIGLTPPVVRYDGVPVGASESRTIEVHNLGSGVLRVHEIELQGSHAFRFEFNGEAYDSDVAIALHPPARVSAAEPLSIVAVFEPTAPGPMSATLRVRSDDNTAPDAGAVVALEGNFDRPCMALAPAELLTFGARQVGETWELPVDIANCGHVDLVVSEIAFVEGSHDAFAIEYASLGLDGAGAPYGADSPLLAGASSLVIPAYGERTVHIQYTPLVESVLDANGALVPHFGSIRFQSNSAEAERLLDVRGVAVDAPCAWPVIEIAQGIEVIPQTLLSLDGGSSFSATGAITEFQWSVDQPTGSGSFFTPSPSVAQPNFEVNVAGEYTFRLQVWDDTGLQSCEPAEATVLVIPDEAIHVELVWSTPAAEANRGRGKGGPGSGADLDLHFVHPFAGGLDVDGDGEPDGWFDVPFDCFWFNPTPVWGSQDPSIDDNPRLDRDDTVGPGPENLNFNGPESGKTYRVGVHYWNDHGFGESFATVYVYLFSELVWFSQDVRMLDLDLWEVCSITWSPDRPTVTPAEAPEGGPKITPSYKNPFF